MTNFRKFDRVKCIDKSLLKVFNIPNPIGKVLSIDYYYNECYVEFSNGYTYYIPFHHLIKTNTITENPEYKRLFI